MNNPYSITVEPAKRLCEITFFFEDGEAYTLPTRYYPGIEEDVRHNYYAWRAHAFAYNRERLRLNNAVNAINALTMIEMRKEGVDLD